MTVGRQPLRVGLLLDSLTVPAWVYTLVDELRRADYAELSVVVLNRAAAGRRPLRARLSTWRRWLLFIVYDKLDRRLHRPPAERDAFAPRDLGELLHGVAEVTVKPLQSRHFDRFDAEPLGQIAAARPDVLLRFGFRILKGEILQLPRFGVWSFHHDDNAEYRGGPPGFWEVFEDNPVSGATLQQLNDEIDNGLVLDKTFVATEFLSVEKNKQALYWRALYSLPRQLRLLHAQGEERFYAAKRPLNPLRFYSRRLYKVPGNAEFAKTLLSYAPKYLARRWRRSTTFEHWHLLYEFGDRLATSPRRLQKLLPPPGRFWADPFPLYRDGQYFIFVEELVYASNKGHIAVIEMDGQGRVSAAKTVVERPYHMSYPFLFDWQGELYMLPETCANGTLEVYRCRRFPDQWQLHKVLLRDLIAVDATLHPHGGRWYLFVNLETPDGSTYDQLHLFSADHPLSDDWRPHPLNPLVSDPRSARPAGRLFEHDGMLLRPAQDCSRSYGHGLVLNQVLTLSDSDYREQVYQSFAADWDTDVHGIHTLNRAGRLTVSDAKLLPYKWRRP